MTKPDPKDPVALTTCTSEFEAETIVAALDERDIHAQAAGSLTAGFRAEAPGVVTVLVRREDLDRARETLAQIRQDASD